MQTQPVCVREAHSVSCPLILQPHLVNVNDWRGNNSFVIAVKLEHTVTGSAVPNLKYGLTGTVHLRPVCKGEVVKTVTLFTKALIRVPQC